MLFPALARWLRISSLSIYRVLTWAVLVAGFAFAALVLGLRYWILPNIDQYHETLAQAISKAAHQRITIGKISGDWDGMQPELVLEDVTVFDHAGRPALKLARVVNTLSWVSLAALEPRFYSIEIDRPALDIRRDARGVISVAGIELTNERGGEFGDWLLRQRELAVRDATISWYDELRGAAPLELGHVNLNIRNDGDRHRFGLRAIPPRHLASPLDLRGDLSGKGVATLTDWNGKLFVQLDSVDIAAWRAWVAFPIEFPQGTGALRLWLTVDQHRLADLIADVRLASVKTRLHRDLPEIDLNALSGRVAWKASPTGFEIATTKLALTTQHGLILQPTDFLLRLTAGKDPKAARGELHANALDLEPLMLLADRLPLDAELHKRLEELSPKGSLFDAVLRWNGDWRAPDQYVVRGRFQDLALNRVGKWPGFSGLSGHLDGNEKSGTIRLDSANATLEAPEVFREPLAFDMLAAQVGWTRGGTGTDLRLNEVAFSNPHAAGTLSGTYRTVPGSRGVADLTGKLTWADARFMSRYVPLVIDKSTRDWLDTSILAGQSNDVSWRLKGNLDHFPFPDNKGGTFQAVAKVTGGALDYATGWPKIENVAGELVFRGKRMDVNVQQGTILGARLARVHAEIPDLKTNYEILRVTGEAEGPTSEFLSYIEKSPVLDMIDRATVGMRAQGNGKLALKLEIPLREREKSKVAGAYQFISNQIVADPDLPPLEQANGRLEFTESAVRVPGANGIFLGGPVAISAATQNDGAVRIDLQGRANIDNVGRFAGNPWWLQHVHGAADWKGGIALRGKLANFVFESTLQGISSSWPAPFAKSAAEAMPLRYERKITGLQQSQVNFSLGDIASARLERRTDGGRSVIQRGTLRLGGGAAPEPEHDGVWVTGALKNFDLDRWRTLAPQGSDQSPLEIAGFDVKFGELAALNRTFHDAAVSGVTQDGEWRSTVVSREFEGAATWRPEGRGKLTARLKKLVIPPGDPLPPTQELAAQRRELPAFDIVADQFQFKDKPLGKLEFVAFPADRDWRIEKLSIANPESTLKVDGILKESPAQPRTQVNLHLDVNDIGKLLTRLGYPKGVQRGTAKLDGTLTWPGDPQEFDYPALSGHLTLDAAKGQFLKLEPGIGKLLGILNLQTLPRRITLDFHDIFSGGFAFDQINGAVKIDHGIATTGNFQMQGPTARVFMTGNVDLARETQRLHVKVTPIVLYDSTSLAGVLARAPVVGAAASLVQKILKNPFDWIVSYEYSVTGTWADPQVSKINRALLPGATNP